MLHDAPFPTQSLLYFLFLVVAQSVLYDSYFLQTWHGI